MRSEWNVTYSYLTDKGERIVNEDYLGTLQTEKGYVFVLCDGLGGHGKGDIASKFVVEQVQTKFRQSYSMEDSIIWAQNALLDKQKRENAEESMKTTVTCLTLDDTSARFGHVGDSRIYYFEKSKYVLRSQDHSVPQMLALSGQIREKDIRYHEDRNRLLRVMGSEWNTSEFQIAKPVFLSCHSSFLLCSDGFWEHITEKMMSRTLRKSKTPEEWLKSMEKIVRKNGAGTNMDNYSAIAVFVR